MHFIFLLLSFSAHSALAIGRRAPAGIAVTENVLELTTVPYAHHLSPPSSRHLARRRNTRHKVYRQESFSADAQYDLLTIGGRVYMVKVTIAGETYTLVIDSGSSDTWVASSTFACEVPYPDFPVSKTDCGFGPLYNASSSTFQPIDYAFAVDYSGGEFLRGSMGIEDFAFGNKDRRGDTSVRQVIGVVDEGFWMGDEISSGLMGLGFPALARGIGGGELNYTSVLYTMFTQPSIPPIFSLALSRPTTANPRAGGLLAIGGIPDIPHDKKWAEVPIQPVVQGVYAWYQISVDGFEIIPPTPSSRSPTPTPTSWPNRLTRSISNPFQHIKQQRQTTANPFQEWRTSMIIDSGTSLLYLPDNIAAYVARLFIPPARYDANTDTYLVPCSAKAPRIGVIIDGIAFYISEHDLMNKGPEGVGGPGVGASSDECAVAIQGSQGGSYILGDAWLNNVLVVFDVGNATDWGVGGSDGVGNGAGSVRVVGREVY